MSFRRVLALATGETFGRGMTWLTVFSLPWILDPSEYGIVVLLATFEGVATGFFLLGQDSAIFWRCAHYDDPDGATASATAAMLITGTFCLVGVVVSLAAAGLIGGGILGVPAWPHVSVLLVGVLFGNVNRVALAFARATNRIQEFVLDRAAVGAGRFASTLGLATVSGSALSFPIGMVVGTAACGLWLCRRLLRGGPLLRSARAQVVPLLRFGAPLSAHLLAMNTVHLVDRWVIGAMLGLAAVGSYGWYYMLGSGVTFLYAAFSVSYEPQIYREFQRSQGTRSLRQYLGVSIAAAGVYGLVGSGVAFIAPDLVPSSVLADPAIAAIVLIGHWFRPIHLGANYLLNSVGRTLRVVGISGVTVVFTVVAAVILVPRLGAIGGAWATLISGLVLVVSSILVAGRLSMPVRVLIQPTLLLSGLALALLWHLTLGSLALASGVLILYGTYSSGMISFPGPKSSGRVVPAAVSRVVR
jgi:O-antigen/teichoic acid export membrane protein